MQTFQEKPDRCPDCSSSRIICTTTVGPDVDDQVSSDIQSGQVVLGGCDALPTGPAWICADCHKEFYRSPD